jgi:serine/threonine protein kinase
MEIIVLENDEYSITQNKRDPTIYTFLFPYFSETLIKSIVSTKLITGATVTDDYMSLSFNAKTVKTLKSFLKASLPYELVLKIIYQLSTQLKYLIETHNETFMGYNINNVIVIDDATFVYISNEELCKIEEGQITISYPFSRNDFYMSPDISNIKEIPSKAHYKSVFYSLGCLMVDCLLFKDEEEERSPHKILDKLPIKQTKLYYFLKRCLSEGSNNRYLLFI